MTGGVPGVVDLGGGVRVTLFETATWRTDAAPLFGPVPKVLWSRVAGDEVDADERVAMVAVALLVETPEARVVVDPGPGSPWRASVPAMVGLDASGLDALVGAVGDVPLDAVILTDLRAEHAGAILDPDAPLRRLASRVVAQADEWEAAHLENDRVALMVDQPAVSVLWESGIAEAIEGPAEIQRGIEVVPAGGFTTGHHVVLVRGRGEDPRSLAFFGDLLPRRWSGNPRWITAFDDLPLDSVTAKAELFGRAAQEQWLVVPSHEPGMPVGRLIADRDRFAFEEVETR